MQINSENPNQCVTETTPWLLRQQLSLGVSLWVKTLKERGGPQSYDTRRMHRVSDALFCSTQPEAILYKVHEKGQTAKAIADLSFLLAVLAFSPGGADFADLHFEVVESP